MKIPSLTLTLDAQTIRSLTPLLHSYQGDDPYIHDLLNKLQGHLYEYLSFDQYEELQEHFDEL